MKWIKNPFKKRALSWDERIWGPLPKHSASGKIVTADTAANISAVWDCVRVLAESFSTLPVNVYKNLPDGGKEKDKTHPLNKILQLQPNNYQSSVTFKEQMQIQLALRGNTYAQKIYNKKGELLQLRPLKGERIEPFFAPDGSVQFKVKFDDGKTTIVGTDVILHIPALVYDGLVGKSPIDAARDSLGLALAAEEHGARYFGNGAMPAGVLEHPGPLSAEASKRLRDSWNEKYSGPENSNKVAVLEEGMKLHTIRVDREQSQFLDSRKFQVSEICRWFRMPPHMVGHFEGGSQRSSIEQQSLEFVIYTLRPWLVRWEKALTLSLLTEEEQQTHFIEFVVDGLLRGDTLTRYQAYKLAREGGWMNIDEIRELENRSPIPEGEGKEFILLPPGMTTIGDKPTTGGEDDTESNQSEDDDEAESEDSRAEKLHFDDLTKQIYPVVAELIGRVVRKHEKEFLKAKKGGASDPFGHSFSALKRDYELIAIPAVQAILNFINRGAEMKFYDSPEIARIFAAGVGEKKNIFSGSVEDAIRLCSENLFECVKGYVGSKTLERVAPSPNFHIHMPALPAPTVNVDVKLPTEERKIITQDIVFKRDENGKITGANVAKEVG